MTTDSDEIEAEIEQLHEALLAIERRQLAYEREMLTRLKQGLFESDIAYGKRVEQENAKHRTFTEAMMVEKAPLEEKLIELKSAIYSVGKRL